MSYRHVAAQGECFATIARRHGIEDWKQLYDHPDNADLKKKRPNPSQLHPADVVMVPTVEPKQRKYETGQIHQLEIKVPKKLLRIAFQDRNGDPVASQPYTLLFPGAPPVEDQTDGDGRIEAKVP